MSDVKSTIKTIFVVPLSHLDIGFTAPQDEVARQYKTYIDQVLAYLDEDPDFSYTIETVWQYLQWERMTHDRTAVARLMEYVRQGRLSIGAAFASMHTGMLGMEELHRVFYHASELRRRYGIPLRSVWMNDIPGYNWALPRTLQAAGTRYFLTGINTSLGGGADIPSASLPFYWEGPDGSRVLTWVSKRNYLEAWTDYHLNGDDEAMEAGIAKVVGEWADEGYPYDTVLAIGAAGDNLGPDMARTFVQKAKAWNGKNRPVQVVVGTAEQFFAHMERRYAGQFPVISGEWNGLWEFARGQNSGGTAITRRTRFLLPGVEALAALSTVSVGNPYPKEVLHTAYERLITYDEHSQGNGNGWPGLLTREQVVRHNKIAFELAREAASALDHAGAMCGIRLPGGVSVDEIEAGAPAGTQVGVRADAQVGTEVRREAQPEVIVYNGLSWPRSGIVEGLPGLWVRDVPPFGFRRFKLPDGSAEASARIESNTIEVRHEDADSVTDEVTVENPWYRVTVNGQGDVTSIYDLRADRECVDQKAAFRWNQLTRASRQDRTQPEPVADPSAVSVTLRSGELSDEIVIRRDNHGVVESRIVLPKEAAQVEFHHVVDMAIIEADPEHRRTDWYTLMFPLAVDPDRDEFLFDTAAGVIRPLKDMMPGAPRGAWAVQSAVAWHAREERSAELVLAETGGPGNNTGGPVNYACRPDKGEWAIAIAHRESFLWSAVPFRRLSSAPAPSTSVLASVLFSINDAGETKDQGVVTFSFDEREPAGTTIRRFSYALTTWTDGFDDAALIRFGYEWNTPLVAVSPMAFAKSGTHLKDIVSDVDAADSSPIDLIDTGSMIELDVPNVMITAVKLPEDAPSGALNELVIRLQETAGKPSTVVHLSLNQLRVARVVVCDLFEQPYTNAGWVLPSDPVRLVIGAKEVVTLRLQLNDERVRI